MLQNLFVDTVCISPLRPKGQQIQRPSIEEILRYKAAGFVPPITVRAQKNSDCQKNYELVLGEKFWMLAQTLKMDQIPALVVEVNDTEMASLIYIDVLSGQNVDSISEAKALKKTLKNGEFRNKAELARYLGCNRSVVHHKMKLLELNTAVQRLVAEKKISALHVRTLHALPDQQQLLLAQSMLKEHLSGHESVQLVSLYKQLLKEQQGSSLSPEQVLEEALLQLRDLANRTEPSIAPPSPAPATSATAIDEGSHLALLSVLEPGRNTNPNRDIDIARLERQISEKFGYLCRIQILPTEAGEYAFRYESGMSEYLVDDLEIALSTSCRLDVVTDGGNSDGGWVCVVFTNNHESSRIADKLVY